jgi:hypothetical protein
VGDDITASSSTAQSGFLFGQWTTAASLRGTCSPPCWKGMAQPRLTWTWTSLPLTVNQVSPLPPVTTRVAEDLNSFPSRCSPVLQWLKLGLFELNNGAKVVCLEWFIRVYSQASPLHSSPSVMLGSTSEWSAQAAPLSQGGQTFTHKEGV